MILAEMLLAVRQDAVRVRQMTCRKAKQTHNSASHSVLHFDKIMSKGGRSQGKVLERHPIWRKSIRGGWEKRGRREGRVVEIEVGNNELRLEIGRKFIAATDRMGYSACCPSDTR